MNAVAALPAIHSFDPPMAAVVRPSLANAGLSPTESPRGGEPRRIGDILPDVLARYGLGASMEAPAANRNPVRRARQG